MSIRKTSFQNKLKKIVVTK